MTRSQEHPVQGGGLHSLPLNAGEKDKKIPRRLCGTITALLRGWDMRMPMNAAQM